jgi:hypothetical protein
VPFACRLAGGPFTGFCCITGGLVKGGWIDGTGWNCCCCWGGDEKLFAGGVVVGTGWNCCCCWGGDEKLFAGGVVVDGDCEGGVPNGLKL